MSDKAKKIAEEAIEPSEEENKQIMLMGGAIAGLNLLLMVFVSFYWTNSDFHTFFTGKPF